MERSHRGGAMVAVALLLAAAGCTSGTPEDRSADQPAPEPSAAPTPEPAASGDATPGGDEATPRGHAEVLAAALAGDGPVRCSYRLDPGVIAASEQHGDSPLLAVGTVYVVGQAARFDSPHADGTTSHILGVQGETYTWKGQQGAHYPGAEPWTKTAAKLEERARDCEPYRGPMDLFEVPGDVRFQTIG